MRDMVGKTITHAVPFETAINQRLYKQSLMEAMVDWAFEANNLESDGFPVYIEGARLEVVTRDGTAALMLTGTVEEA